MRLVLSLTLMTALVAAQQAAPNAELAKKLKQRKIDRFFKQIEADRLMPGPLKAKVLKFREGATLGGEYGCIHQSLLEIYPDYKAADALLYNERFEAAADALTKLRSHENEYVKAYALFRFGLCEMNRDNFEEAAAIFQDVLNKYGRYVGCDIESAYYRVICLGQSREKEAAITAAKNFLRDYPDASERYRKSMEQVLNELVQEWESPLYDLAGRMDKAAREIERGKTGKGTQVEQKEIVDIIEELIKRAEQQEGQGQGQNNGGQQTPRDGNQSNSPLNKSKVAPGASRTGNLGGKKKPKPGDQWGKMRDKEREEVLQSLKEKFPDRYRELLEQYHRQLAEGKRVTESDR